MLLMHDRFFFYVCECKWTLFTYFLLYFLWLILDSSLECEIIHAHETAAEESKAKDETIKINQGENNLQLPLLFILSLFFNLSSFLCL